MCSSLPSTKWKSLHIVGHWLASSSNYFKLFQTILNAVCTWGVEAKVYLIPSKETKPWWHRLRNSSTTHFTCYQSWWGNGPSAIHHRSGASSQKKQKRVTLKLGLWEEANLPHRGENHLIPSVCCVILIHQLQKLCHQCKSWQYASLWCDQWQRSTNTAEAFTLSEDCSSIGSTNDYPITS